MNFHFSNTNAVFKTYLLTLSIFVLLRFIFIFVNFEHVSIINNLGLFFSSIVWGLRFDNVPVISVLFVPFILLIIYDFKPNRLLMKIAFWWSFILLSFLIFMYAGDIVYFNNYYMHINKQAFIWFNDPKTVFMMIFTEPRLWFMFIPFFIIEYFFYKLLIKLFRPNPEFDFVGKKAILLNIILLVFMFFGAKGRLISHRLMLEDAYSGENVMFDKFKINPVFSLIQSYASKNHSDLDLIDKKEAIKNVQNYFNIPKDSKLKSPIARKITFPDSLRQPKNVVFIFMERKATWKMKYFGNTQKMTPFLDSLFLQSMSFDNFYSGGTRTFEGIYASLYSYPIQFDYHPFKDVVIKKYYGLPHILHDHNYNTVFFCPHTQKFDNLGKFLPDNGFDKVYFERDYPEDSLKTNWGVDDHYLFNFSIKKIDELAKQNKPFFASILTISDHEPYWVPDYIKGDNIKIRAARFADWSLQHFFRDIKNKPWFDNTIFVMFGDHGKPYEAVYETELSSHHVPLIIYYKGVQPEMIHHIADQKDIMPTIMNLLSLDYINNSFGTDYQNAKYVYANHYDKNIVLDNDFLLILDEENRIHGLYKYREKDITDYQKTYPEKTKEMATFLRSQLQAAKYVIDRNYQFIKPKK